MAWDGSPPAKRARLDDDILYGRPEQHAVSELYNPTMIKIRVYNAAQDPDGTTKEVFVVPRGLICLRSEYFDKMFKGGFVESKSLRVELDDVEPWVFKCFVGWLYTQRVYYDPDRVEPVEPVKPDGGDGVPEDEEMTEDEAVTEGTAETSPEDEEYEGEDEGGKTNTEVTRQAPTEKNIQSSVLSNRPVGISAANASGTETEPKSDGEFHETAPHEDDHQKPITWAWGVLFDLFIFADKYSSHEFRKIVFGTIQMKVMQQRPRAYQFPSTRTIKKAVENLPASSPLFRLLVDMVAVGIDL